MLLNAKRATKAITVLWLVISLTAFIFLAFSISSEKSYYADDGIAALSKLGSRGDEVRSIQRKLKELGYYTGSVDGIYGVNTQSAVKKFQKNCGLKVDGIAGSKTLLYLGLGSSSSSSSVYSSTDSSLLARIISAEARGESYTGQVAVGAVVLNRVSHSSFPNTVAGVIYQNGAFDAVKDSNWSASVTSSAKKAAQDALNGWDPTGGAIYYYNPATATSKWILSRPVITRIGNHVFCR